RDEVRTCSLGPVPAACPPHRPRWWPRERVLPQGDRPGDQPEEVRAGRARLVPIWVPVVPHGRPDALSRTCGILSAAALRGRLRPCPHPATGSCSIVR